MGAALSSIGRSVPSRAIRTVWLASPTTTPSRRARQGGVLGRLAGVLVDDAEDLRQGLPRGLGLGPPGQGLGHPVEVGHPALGVGADDRVADAGEGDPQPLPLGGELPLGLLAGEEDGPGVLERDGPEPPLLVVVAGRHHPTPSSFDARAVPSTRARIFAKAVSRVVDVSSQKGANPQSSVVPSCSSGMYSAASRTRSRTSSGVSTRGSIGATTPTKTL